jgi:hypothetical protein
VKFNRDDDDEDNDDEYDDEYGGMTRDDVVHVVRVFAQVEGREKQAIATHGGSGTRGVDETNGRGVGGMQESEAARQRFYTREEACAAACAAACERATTSADAEDGYELCEAACADACERRADASGKFEVCLNRGSEATIAWERDLAERRREEERREKASVSASASASQSSGVVNGGGRE